MTPLKNIKQDLWMLPPAEQIQAIAADYGVTAEIVQMEENPLEARAAAIAAAFQDEPMSRAEALELIDELAEIQTQLGKE